MTVIDKASEVIPQECAKACPWCGVATVKPHSALRDWAHSKRVLYLPVLGIVIVMLSFFPLRNGWPGPTLERLLAWYGLRVVWIADEDGWTYKAIPK